MAAALFSLSGKPSKGCVTRNVIYIRIYALRQKVKKKVIDNIFIWERMEKPNKTSKVSLAEVAQAAGVSKMTASRVLRRRGGYSAKTEKKVMAQVDLLGYLPNRLATVFSGETNSTFVGVCRLK